MVVTSGSVYTPALSEKLLSGVSAPMVFEYRNNPDPPMPSVRSIASEPAPSIGTMRRSRFCPPVEMLASSEATTMLSTRKSSGDDATLIAPVRRSCEPTTTNLPSGESPPILPSSISPARSSVSVSVLMTSSCTPASAARMVVPPRITSPPTASWIRRSVSIRTSFASVTSAQSLRSNRPPSAFGSLSRLISPSRISSSVAVTSSELRLLISGSVIVLATNRRPPGPSMLADGSMRTANAFSPSNAPIV